MVLARKCGVLERGADLNPLVRAAGKDNIRTSNIIFSGGLAL
jgi:hypothetical protein